MKGTLKELVVLPFQRPELFCKGQLTKVLICLLFFPICCLLLQVCFLLFFLAVVSCASVSLKAEVVSLKMSLCDYDNSFFNFVFFVISYIPSSLAREYCFLVLQVQVRQCWQRQLQPRQVQILSTYPCQALPSRY